MGVDTYRLGIEKLEIIPKHFIISTNCVGNLSTYIKKKIGEATCSLIIGVHSNHILYE